MGKYQGLGNDNGKWKGNNASYYAFHAWIRYHYGKPLKCDRCGDVGKMTGRRWSIEYALKPGLLYSRTRDDYESLCKSCHRTQDMTDKMRLNISKATKGNGLGNTKMYLRKSVCLRGHQITPRVPCKECNRIRTKEWRIKSQQKNS